MAGCSSETSAGAASGMAEAGHRPGCGPHHPCGQPSVQGQKGHQRSCDFFFLKNKVSVKFDQVKDFVAALNNLLATPGQEVRSEGRSLSRAAWPFPLTVYLCVLWYLPRSGGLFCSCGNSSRPRLKLGLPTQAPSV